MKQCIQSVLKKCCEPGTPRPAELSFQNGGRLRAGGEREMMLPGLAGPIQGDRRYSKANVVERWGLVLISSSCDDRIT